MRVLFKSTIIFGFVNVLIISSCDPSKARIGVLGGHELFSSLAQVKLLWYNEQGIVNKLKTVVNKFDNPPTELVR